jgi:hypothetical protein
MSATDETATAVRSHWTTTAITGKVQPSGGRLEGVRRGGVERDRRVASMPAQQVDDPLEQFQLIAHTAADDDALPRLRAQGSGDDRLHVIATVETEQTEFSPHTVLDEPGPSDFDAVCHGLGIPRPGHPVRIEPDHEHTRSERRLIHC